MKTKLLFLLFVCSVVVNSASGQNLTITAPETNNFITTTTVPNGTAAQTTLRAHFIIPASELQGIPAGTSIDELGVNIQAVGVGTASGTLQFYLENTSDVTNNKSENWVTAITPMTSVYNGPFAIPAAAGPADFAIASPFTYNGGGLYVAYEYIGSTFATTGSQYWVNTELAGSCKYSSTSTTTPADSVNDISSSRPEIRFTFVNPFTNNLEVSEVESDFGVGNSFLTDDLEFTVEVTNIGTQPVNNVPVTLEFIGPVTYTATETVSSIASNSSQLVTFTSVPTVNVPGTFLKVSVPADQQTFNDSLIYYQQFSCDSIGYVDAGVATSSVGFNTGQGILGVRYDISNNVPVNIESIEIRVGNNAASPGNVIKGVLLNSSGTIVDSSLAHTITTADLGQTLSLPLLNGNVNYANQTVFAGIRQTANATLGYYPVGLQEKLNPITDRNMSSGINGGTITYQNTLPPFMIMLTTEVRPLLIFSDAAQQECAGSPVSFDVFPTTFQDYLIYSGTTLLQSNTTGNFIVNPTTTTTYDILAKNGSCFAPTATVTVQVVNEFNVAINEEICAGDSYNFNGQSLTTAGQYIDTVQSLGGCDSIITLDLSVLQPSSAIINESICEGDVYTLNGMDYSASGTYTDVISNSVGCDSTVTLNLSVLLADLVVTHTGATLTASTTTAGATYQWVDCLNNNAPIAGETSQSFTPTVNMGIVGEYAVEVTASNCIKLSNCSTVDFTGLDNTGLYNLTVYPNPTTSVLRIDSGLSDIGYYSIFNMEGKLITTVQANITNQSVISVEDLEAGTYLLEVGNKQVSTRTIFTKQ